MSASIPNMFPCSPIRRALRTRNAVNLMAMDAADWGHSATHWQRNLYPPEIRRRITTIHEGVDTDIARPFAQAEISLARDKLVLTAKDEVITFVARNLEPYRGFHIFMRALPEILRRRPKAHAVIVGGDGVSYGSPAAPGTTYREAMLQEVGADLDLTRVHFIGQVPYSGYINLLQISSAHVYLTYPFVLSWSFIEALACGCVVIGSATPPVLEVLEDGVNGFTVDFFAIDDLARSHRGSIEAPQSHGRNTRRPPAPQRLRATTSRRMLPRWEGLIDDLLQGRRPDTDLS